MRFFRFPPAWILLLAAISLMAGCSKLTPANLDKVNVGMNPVQVEEILGKATGVATTTMGPIQSTKWTYQKGGNEVTLIFLNDKLLSKEGSFGK